MQNGIGRTNDMIEELSLALMAPGSPLQKKQNNRFADVAAIDAWLDEVFIFTLQWIRQFEIALEKFEKEDKERQSRHVSEPVVIASHSTASLPTSVEATQNAEIKSTTPFALLSRESLESGISYCQERLNTLKGERTDLDKKYNDAQEITVKAIIALLANEEETLGKTLGNIANKILTRQPMAAELIFSSLAYSEMLHPETAPSVSVTPWKPDKPTSRGEEEIAALPEISSRIQLAHQRAPVFVKRTGVLLDLGMLFKPTSGESPGSPSEMLSLIKSRVHDLRVPLKEADYVSSATNLVSNIAETKTVEQLESEMKDELARREENESRHLPSPG